MIHGEIDLHLLKVIRQREEERSQKILFRGEAGPRAGRAGRVERPSQDCKPRGQLLPDISTKSCMTCCFWFPNYSPSNLLMMFPVFFVYFCTYFDLLDIQCGYRFRPKMWRHHFHRWFPWHPGSLGHGPCSLFTFSAPRSMTRDFRRGTCRCG